MVVLRLKRARNPDVACLERLQHFLQDMNRRDAVTLLCGVRPDFASAMEKVGFNAWLPPERVFHETGANFSSTLAALRYAYELLGEAHCDHCPRRNEANAAEGTLYYMI